MRDTLDLIESSLFGIDVDSQAVVWTRRALLLAAWSQGRANGAEATDKTDLHIPDLRQNIVCRDFLAADGVAAGEGSPGSFHVILGGPPFVRLHEMLRADPAMVERYRREYGTARSGQFDLFMPFFEQAIRRLEEGGWLAWSVASTFLRTASGRPLRSLIGGSCGLHELVEFEDAKLYPDAVTQIVLVLLEKTRREVSCRHAWVARAGGLREKLTAVWCGPPREHPDVAVRCLLGTEFRKADWSFGSQREKGILARLEAVGTPLGRLPVTICQGVVTGADPVFLVRRVACGKEGETLVLCRDRGRHILLESALLRPIIRNRDVRGYGKPAPKDLCLVPYDASGRLLAEDTLRTMYPLTYGYLLTHQEALARHRGTKPNAWYAFRSSASLLLPPGPKLLMGLICSGGDFTVDVEGNMLAHSTVLLLAPDPRRVDPFYLLGVLNSRAFWFFVRQTMPTMGEGRHVLRRTTLRRFPLAVPGEGRAIDLQRPVAEAVRGILERGKAVTNSPNGLEEIERLVAEIYGVEPADFEGDKPVRT